jgi:hypothetical protein
VAAIAGAAAGAWIAIASRGPVMPIAEFDDELSLDIEPAETN